MFSFSEPLFYPIVFNILYWNCCSRSTKSPAGQLIKVNSFQNPFSHISRERERVPQRKVTSRNSPISPSESRVQQIGCSFWLLATFGVISSYPSSLSDRLSELKIVCKQNSAAGCHLFQLSIAFIPAPMGRNARRTIRYLPDRVKWLTRRVRVRQKSGKYVIHMGSTPKQNRLFGVVYCASQSLHSSWVDNALCIRSAQFQIA